LYCAFNAVFAGDLIVTSSDKTVFFTSDIAAPPLTDYEIGTLNTKILITVVEKALKYGVKGTIQTSSGIFYIKRYI
jgi:hypothetical protein